MIWNTFMHTPKGPCLEDGDPTPRNWKLHLGAASSSHYLTASSDEDSSILQVAEVKALSVLATGIFAPFSHCEGAYKTARRVFFPIRLDFDLAYGSVHPGSNVLVS